jgi:hypothetical protein
MTDSRIQPGAFVRHDRFGVGRATKREVSGAVTVEFKSGESHQMSASVAGNLKVLPQNGLEAQTWTGMAETRSWIDDAPLKLIAAAIADIGNAPRVSEIKNALQGPGRVFDGDVKLSPSWWKRAKEAAAKDSKHFLADRNKSNNITAIRLISDVDNVPSGPLPSLPRKVNSAALWKKWLNGETPNPPTLTWPPKPPKSVSNALAKWPAKSIDKALDQTIQGAEEFLWSDRNSSQVAGAWLEALSRVSMRWIECTWPESDQYLTDRIPELIERLSVSRPLGLPLFLAGALSGQLDEQRSQFHEKRLEQQYKEQERQRTDYENRLDQQRQEQERQRADYASRLEKQRQEQERQHATHTAELEELREAQETLLERERQEQERLRQQVRERNAELASNREESRLEIRQDMLLAVGEVLQSVRRAASVEELAGNAEAGLTLALRAGGAEPLETPGEQVAYDPGKHHLENYHLEKHDLEKHHAEGGLPGSSLVRVVAPGVVYRGGIHGDRVLLKAHVKHEAG